MTQRPGRNAPICSAQELASSTLFDSGQASSMGDPQAKTEQERWSKNTWHSAAPRSQFKNRPMSFLLNKHWNYDCHGEITLAEGKEELKMSLSS